MLGLGQLLSGTVCNEGEYEIVSGRPTLDTYGLLVDSSLQFEHNLALHAHVHVLGSVNIRAQKINKLPSNVKLTQIPRIITRLFFTW